MTVRVPGSHRLGREYAERSAAVLASAASYSGHTASLWSWWVHHKLLVNTEQQSGHDWVAVPTDLTNGGTSFQTQFVPQYPEPARCCTDRSASRVHDASVHC